MAFEFIGRIFNKTPDGGEQRSVTVPVGVVATNWNSAFFTGGRNSDNLSIIYGCVNLIANGIASLPVQLNRQLEQGHEAAKDHPYYGLITSRPNGYQTTRTFYHYVVTQLLLTGNCYIQKLRRGNMQVAELIPLCPSYVQISINEDGKPHYRMNLVSADGKTFVQDFEADQIIHLKHYSRDGIIGVSAIENFAALFNGYQELETAGNQIAKNAAKPNGYISHPSNVREDVLSKVKSVWASGFSGDHSGKMAFLPDGYKWEAAPSGLSAQAADLVNQKTFTAQRIVADVFGCPLYKFGLTTTTQYSSVEEQNRAFLTDTLRPIIVNLEQQIQKDLLENDESVYVNFDTREWTRGNQTAQLELYRFLLSNGAMTRNQVNAELDTGYTIPESKGGNDYIIPLNMAVVGQSTGSMNKTPVA